MVPRFYQTYSHLEHSMVSSHFAIDPRYPTTNSCPAEACCISTNINLFPLQSIFLKTMQTYQNLFSTLATTYTKVFVLSSYVPLSLNKYSKFMRVVIVAHKQSILNKQIQIQQVVTPLYIVHKVVIRSNLFLVQKDKYINHAPNQERSHKSNYLTIS